MRPVSRAALLWTGRHNRDTLSDGYPARRYAGIEQYQTDRFMLCETCQTNEATVHIASVMHAVANVDARHFCEPCAQVAQTANPVLSVTARNLPPVHVTPVMSVGTPALVRIQSVEKKLAELDPAWEAFCSRHEYLFRPGRELWPNRMAFAHGTIDRQLVLTMDVPFPELLNRGFWADMPWSLYAIARLPFWSQSPCGKSQPQAGPAGLYKPVLTFELFRRTPFLELGKVLEKELERGFSLLSEVNREDVLRKGEVPHNKSVPFRSYPW